MIYDFNYDQSQLGADFAPYPDPGQLPPGGNDAGCGKDGQTFFGVGQSRFGLYAYVPTSAGQLKSQFEFDFFGVGADAGQTTIRLRQFWGELGPFLAGQTNSLFMDGDVFPNVIDYWGPSGMVFFRNIQLRYTPLNARRAEGRLRARAAGHQRRHDVGRFRQRNALEHVARPHGAIPPGPQVGALPGLRDIALDRVPDALGASTEILPGKEVGWGINLAGAYKTFGKDQLLAQVVYGHGIANYMNDARGRPRDQRLRERRGGAAARLAALLRSLLEPEVEQHDRLQRDAPVCNQRTDGQRLPKRQVRLG